LNAHGVFFTSEGGVRAGWRIVLFIILCAIFFKIFGALAVYARFGSYAVSELETYVFILFAVWLAHYVMLRFVDRKPWSYVGLGRENLTPRVLLIGLALGSLCILIPSGGLLLAHDLTFVTGLQGRHSWIELAGGGMLLFLAQSLGEEMISRGYLFSGLRDAFGAYGAPASLALTSIGFGLLHMANPGATAQSVCIVILAGAFLGAILMITRSLYAAWMAHFAWNWSMAEVLHSSVSGIRFPYSTYRVDDVGPPWLTGGSWGPEGGAAAAVSMVAGIALLVAWQRRVARNTPNEVRSA
jgi:membrane protease YdiL (CAAX protease family)